MRERSWISIFDSFISSVGVLLSIFRLFGLVYFFDDSPWWLWVPIFVLLFFSVCSLAFLRQYRALGVGLVLVYVVSYIFGGWGRIFVEKQFFPDLLEFPLVFYFCFRIYGDSLKRLYSK